MTDETKPDHAPFGWVVYKQGQAFAHLFDGTWSVRPATAEDWANHAITLNRMIPCQ